MTNEYLEFRNDQETIVCYDVIMEHTVTEMPRVADAGIASTRLTGASLRAMQVVWLAVALVAVGLVLAGVSPYFGQLSSVCTASAEMCEQSSSLMPAQVAALAAVGVDLPQYATIILAIELSMLAVWVGVAIVIFWLRADDWMALLVSAMLIVFSTSTFVAGSLEAAPLRWPQTTGLVLGLGLLGELLITAFFLLFPNGRLVPRWLWWLFPLRIVTSAMNYVPAFSTLPDWTWFVTFFVPLAFMVAAPVYRYRRVSTPYERHQTRWVLYGVTIGLGIFLSAMIVTFFNRTWEATWAPLLWTAMTMLVTFIPISIGIAMLRSNLWDIDVVIRRTTVYAVLTALLALVYFGSIVILQQFLTPLISDSAPAVVLSTLLIAALFLPLRRARRDRPALLSPQIRRREGAGRIRGYGARRDRPRCADSRVGAGDSGDDAAGAGQCVAVRANIDE